MGLATRTRLGYRGAIGIELRHAVIDEPNIHTYSHHDRRWNPSPTTSSICSSAERSHTSHPSCPTTPHHVVPTWVDYDGEYVLVNAFRTSRKEKNVRKRPDIALSMTDPENAYRFLAVRAEVVEIAEEGAIDHINALAKR